MATRGEEDGVPWQWTNNLGLNVAVGQAMAQVGVHELHQREVAGLHGNVFYGSFSVVNEFGHYYHHTQVLEAHPTKTAHTEPQYFEWLAAQVRSLSGIPQLTVASAKAFILEINQTNTPCSAKTCRKAILACVASNTVGGFKFPIVVARMSAYQIYESQYPKVCPTSEEIKWGKLGTPQTNALEPMCLHKFPG